jgi:hypothetical protein
MQIKFYYRTDVGNRVVVPEKGPKLAKSESRSERWLYYSIPGQAKDLEVPALDREKFDDSKVPTKVKSMFRLHRDI